MLKQAGVYDRRKLFGITTLDVIRAETFVARARGLEPRITSYNVCYTKLLRHR